MNQVFAMSNNHQGIVSQDCDILTESYAVLSL